MQITGKSNYFQDRVNYRAAECVESVHLSKELGVGKMILTRERAFYTWGGEGKRCEGLERLNAKLFLFCVQHCLSECPEVHLCMVFLALSSPDYRLEH